MNVIDTILNPLGVAILLSMVLTLVLFYWTHRILEHYSEPVLDEYRDKSTNVDVLPTPKDADASPTEKSEPQLSLVTSAAVPHVESTPSTLEDEGIDTGQGSLVDYYPRDCIAARIPSAGRAASKRAQLMESLGVSDESVDQRVSATVSSRDSEERS